MPDKEEWWKSKLEEQREQFACEIIALRQTLSDMKKGFNTINSLEIKFSNKGKYPWVLKSWEEYLKTIFMTANKYKE